MPKFPTLPQELIDFAPEVGLILGSGLGFFADDRIEVVGRLPYSEIEGFPVSTVVGHAGQFVYGMLGQQKVLCMQGRFHFYEGYSMEQVTLPIKLMKSLGVETLFVTNAAGGISKAFKPGDFMLISDHINFMGTNALIGTDPGEGPRFPDMSVAYDAELRKAIQAWAESASIPLHTGVYLATTGPSYETPAEIRMFAGFGADAVGMSTIPEVTMARQLGMRAIGFSCITNAAAGISDQLLSHEEVAETANQVRGQFADLLAGAVNLV